MKIGSDPYSLSEDESVLEGCFQASASIQQYSVTKEGRMEEVRKESFLDRMEERDFKQTRTRFYPKVKSRNNRYSRPGVCVDNNNDDKDDQNNGPKKTYFGSGTLFNMKENQNIPDNSVCGRTNNSVSNGNLIKTDMLNNGDLVEKEVHGDKIVNYYLDNDGNRILLPGFVFTTKNDLHEHTRIKSYNCNGEENVVLDRSVSIRAQSDDENETSWNAGPKSNAKIYSTGANFKKPLLTLATKKEEEKLKPGLSSKGNLRNGKQVKASAIDKGGEKRTADELIEKRYLNKWVPFLKNKKLYIEGDLINFDSLTPSDMSSKWRTSKIVSRISEREVGTKKTCYVLEGQLAIPAPGDRSLPLFVIDMFRNGFPENWNNILQHWIHLKRPEDGY